MMKARIPRRPLLACGLVASIVLAGFLVRKWLTMAQLERCMEKHNDTPENEDATPRPTSVRPV